MANNGIKTYITLNQVEGPCPVPCTPTGNVKNNAPSDPDYIAPYQDLVACPVTYTLDCPVVIWSGTTNSILTEFSLEPNVVNNPSVKSIRTSLKQGSTTISSYTFTLPNTPSPNYFNHTFPTLTGTSSFDYIVEYLNASNTVVKTCPSVTMTTT